VNIRSKKLNKDNNNNTELLLLCKYPGCLKEFTSRWSLTRHLKIHSGIKSFICNQCNKKFIQKCSLTRHQQTHLKESIWICDYNNCEKRFKLKEYLEIHKKSHHQSLSSNSSSSRGVDVDTGKSSSSSGDGSCSNSSSSRGVDVDTGKSSSSSGDGSSSSSSRGVDVYTGKSSSSSGDGSSSSSSSRGVDVDIGKRSSSSGDGSSNGINGGNNIHVGIIDNNNNISNTTSDVDHIMSNNVDQQPLNQLKNHLMTMSIQHYQSIYKQQEKEQQLVAALQETSSALEGFLTRLKNYRNIDDIPIELLVTLIETKKLCSHLL